MSTRTSKTRLDPSSRKDRSGNILVLMALLLIPMCGFVAFAIDVGYMGLARTQLQAAADAGALAGAQVLFPTLEDIESPTYTLAPDFDAARAESQTFVRYNGAGEHHAQFSGGGGLHVDSNGSNSAEGDIVFGHLYNPLADPTEPLQVSMENPNTVMVRIPMRASHQNGALALFFAPVLGIATADAEAFAMATVQYPTVLPITTSEEKWQTVENGGGGDGDDFSAQNGQVSSGGDGVPEIRIFPGRWDGVEMPPGNFGTIDIGPSQGTAVLRRQIDLGPSVSDLAVHGGSLRHGMGLSGATGVNGDIQTAFRGGNADGRAYPGILGETRWLPIYSNVEGNGNNALFTISRFVLVRVVDADLTGHNKHVTIQPAQEGEQLVKYWLSR